MGERARLAPLSFSLSLSLSVCVCVCGFLLFFFFFFYRLLPMLLLLLLPAVAAVDATATAASCQPAASSSSFFSYRLLPPLLLLLLPAVAAVAAAVIAANHSKNCPNFKKLFPEYIEKYNQLMNKEQLAPGQQKMPEHMSTTASTIRRRVTRTEAEENDAPKVEAPRRQTKKVPVWLLVLLASVFGFVMALPLLQL